MDGGSTVGSVDLYNSEIQTVKPARTPSTLFILGRDNSLTTDILPNITLWVLGADGNTNSHATLTLPQSVTNHGTIQLESENQAWTSQVVVQSGTLTNAPDGTIIANPGSGGVRAITGNLANLGHLRITQPTSFLGDSSTFINSGIIQILNSSATFGGTAFTNTSTGIISSAGYFSATGLVNNGVIDLSPPSVIDVVQRVATIAVTYFAPAGMNTSTVTNTANYHLTASGGDGIFGNGNDVDLSSQIAGVIYDIPSASATIELSTNPPADVLQLRINGQAVIDNNGTELLNTDFVTQVLPDSIPPIVSLVLETSSDSGASSTDHITNITTPTFDVSVNKGGTVAIDFDDDGIADAAQTIAGPGTLTFTSPALADGTYTALATFTPFVGSPVTSQTSLVIDTTPPTLLPGAASEHGPLSRRQIHFSEPIDSSRSLAPSQLQSRSQAQAEIARSPISPALAEPTLTFPLITVGGKYTISVDTAILDIAGNQIAALASKTRHLIQDTTPPSVVSLTPQGLGNQNVSQIQIGFSEAIDTSPINSSDISIVGPSGTIDPSTFTIAIPERRRSRASSPPSPRKAHTTSPLGQTSLTCPATQCPRPSTPHSPSTKPARASPRWLPLELSLATSTTPTSHSTRRSTHRHSIRAT